MYINVYVKNAIIVAHTNYIQVSMPTTPGSIFKIQKANNEIIFGSMKWHKMWIRNRI